MCLLRKPSMGAGAVIERYVEEAGELGSEEF
jgi:hypothetical protein